MKVIIPIGIPGSGKSHHRPENFIVLCKDEIRFMLLNYPESGNDYDERLEGIIDVMDKILYLNILERGWNIYLDETNLTAKHRKFYIERALEKSYEVELHYYSNVTSAIARNATRERTIRTEVMVNMIADLEGPTDWEKERCTVKEIA